MPLTNAATLHQPKSVCFYTLQQRLIPMNTSTHLVGVRPIYTAFDSNRPEHTPVLIGWAVFDGTNGTLVDKNEIEAFIESMPRTVFVFDDATIALATLSQVFRSIDPYKLVDENRILDMGLLRRLALLATTGESSLPDAEVPSNGSATRNGINKNSSSTPAISPFARIQDLRPDIVRTSGQAAINLHHSIRGYVFVTSDGNLVASSSSYNQILDCFGRLESWDLHRAGEKWGWQTHNIQLRAAIACRQITVNGMKIDPAAVNQLVTRLTTQQESLRRGLMARGYIAGCSTSGKLDRILTRIFAEEGHPTPPRDADGHLDTSADALRPLSDHPFVAALIQHRQNSAILQNFGSKLRAATGRIHPRIDVLKVTGRTSSYGDLSAQNIPRSGGVRECIIASPGHVLVSADYATIELVALAYAIERQFHAGSYLAAAIRGGCDIHRYVAAKLLGKQEHEVTDIERRAAKVINFGVPGCMCAESLQRHASAAYGLSLTLEQAEEYRQGYLRAFPEIADFLRSQTSDTDTFVGIATRLTLTSDGYYAALRGSGVVDTSSPPRVISPAILAGMALRVYGKREPITRSGRPYSTAEIGYFWGALAAHIELVPQHLRRYVMQRKPSRKLQQAVSSLAPRGSVMTATGRVRANVSETAKRNTIFQGLAADGAKNAMWLLHRARYRIVNFVHDEFLLEVRDDGQRDAHVKKITELMQYGMSEVLPGFPIRVNVKVSARWESEGSEATALERSATDSAA